MENKGLIEDYLFWMFKVTYEIEMHINAIVALDRVFSKLQRFSQQSADMIFYHNQLALIQSAYLLKSKPKRDEKHSIFTLRGFLYGQGVKINVDPLKKVMNDIDLFYTKNEIDISKIIRKRDGEAHQFKLSHQMKINNENYVSLNRNVELIYIAREILTDIHYILFERDFPNELKYDVNIYDKIYKNGLL
ncbi:hypothetical protein [Sphingobacterium siyangense]|nr:hypothetical protein [Sphingobacterium siyangense]